MLLNLGVLPTGPLVTYRKLSTVYVTTITNNSSASATNVILQQNVSGKSSAIFKQITGPFFAIQATTNNFSVGIKSFAPGAIAEFQTVIRPKIKCLHIRSVVK